MDVTNHIFTKNQLDAIFNTVINQTLGDVDRNNVFNRTIGHDKITGIAGDVIEQSVLGYPADSYQKPDLIVDGVEVELKTTGIRKSKKNSNQYEAKEPMSITAVSPENIVTENFETSNFWHKLEHLLLVYYLYDSEKSVVASEYARFPIKGYDFHEFNDDEKEILRNDWTIVSNYIRELQTLHEIPEDFYPTISSKLRPNLMMIDTAPKWPHRPRFRLKRTAVTTLVQQHFGKNLETLDQDLNSFAEIDHQLSLFTRKYQNKTIRELLNIFSIPIKLGSKGDVAKSVTEQIVTHMFGASSHKISNIKLFSEIGLVGKTITQTTSGNRTEDTKLLSIDFEEWLDPNITYEESSLYDYFNETQFLFIIFEEQSSKDKLLDNKFKGFKRLSFNETFINDIVKSTWEDTRTTIFENQLVEINRRNAKGELIINKNGVVSTKINLPKSATHQVFLRGTGNDSSNKPVEINGIKMYRQYVWIKGTSLVALLNDISYI
ncbi:restriction endonuclease [Latilactobacillus curvatus]|nr:restriction endonuclease [Latilactobacillus curvatus]